MNATYLLLAFWDTVTFMTVMEIIVDHFFLLKKQRVKDEK